MNIRSLSFCLVLLILSCMTSFGQESDLNQVGTSMANFLKIGVGARATAMGDAYVAVSDDITSLYWNPGGLATLKKNEALFQITDWLLDMRLYFFGISYNTGNLGTIGCSIYSFSSGEMEETTIDKPDGTGRTFSAADFAAGLTYSKRLTDRFSAGMTLKYISERLDQEKASTVAIDVGSIFMTNFLNDMRIGFALSNLGGQMQLEGPSLTVQHIEDPGTKYTRAQLGTDSWDIPLLIRFGVATDVVRRDDLRVTIASEVMDSRDFTHRAAAGGELAVRDMVFFRGGYKIEYDEADVTLGFGLKIISSQGIEMRVDYAYGTYGLLDNAQRFSIIFAF
ncbi:MAG: PorV/PorQ family protein [Gemmatimonadota bacterium]|nr:MAG: PorV/PorQ family protein [Gemmatimonadota bacterium]